MTEAAGVPPLPGGIGISHLRVYTSVAPDGLAGGTPHLHTTCTEAYAVVRGEGAVQTISGEGFREVPLAAGSLVWFTPGTIHRLVNRSGDLEIFVLMQNAGLPERGDLVITFPEELLADGAAYWDAAVLPGGSTTTQSDDAAARRRRDLGVEGFVSLRADLKAGRTDTLVRFYNRAAALVGERVPGWRDVVGAGPVAAVERTLHQLDALAKGDAHHLLDSSVHERPPPVAERRYGCCGTLGTYVSRE